MPISLGIGVKVTEGGAPAFSPITLSPFTWYDPSDLSTLFQDSAGTTPVTANNDPVGRMNDKSGNGHHLLQTTAGARPLYKTSGGLHWLESVSSDFLLATRTANQPLERVGAWRILSLVAGTIVLANGSNGGGGLALFVDGSGTELRLFAGGQVQGLAVPAQDVDFVATERFNGASSRLAVDNGTYQTGDVGAGTDTELCLFANSGGTANFIVARCYGLVEFSSLQTDASIAQLRTYYGNKQGRSL